MRYPSDQKVETHERIVDAAARSFREHGFEGLGIATLMQDLGLTQGGFYRHFDSKEDLYIAAVTRGLEETARGMISAVEAAPKRKPLRAIIEYYLSPGHMACVGGGCVIAALTPEIGRQSESVRQRINASVEALITRLLPYLKGNNDAEKRRQFYLLIPSMAGVLMMARATSEKSLQTDILKSARTFYVNAFA